MEEKGKDNDESVQSFFFYQREKGGLENCDVMERKKRKND